MGWLSLAVGGRKGKNEALEQELQVLTEGAREERNRSSSLVRVRCHRSGDNWINYQPETLSDPLMEVLTCQCSRRAEINSNYIVPVSHPLPLKQYLQVLSSEWSERKKLFFVWLSAQISIPHYFLVSHPLPLKQDLQVLSSEWSERKKLFIVWLSAQTSVLPPDFLVSHPLTCRGEITQWPVTTTL